MAERRMFTKKITESDAFLDMPASSQALYFHLNMSADDDGFVNNPKRIQRLMGASDDDMKLLIMKRFVIAFESGIIVIKHWKMHNYIQNDRYKPTDYIDEKSQLFLKKNKSYTLSENKMDTKCIQDVSVGKVSIDKVSKEKDVKPSVKKSSFGEFNNVKLTEEEYQNLVDKNLLQVIDRLSVYIESSGKKYKSHYATILNWSRKDEEQKPKAKTYELPDL